VTPVVVRKISRMLIVALLVVALAASVASADVIRVQSTTDTVDAGLVDGLLKPAYRAVHPEDELQYTAVGTGRALDNARAGLGDVVITHARTLEQQFVLDGYSLEPAGRAIFYSDYVIVGPRSDPAGVGASAAHDAISAFEAIASAGDASFVSRGDNSGTNVQEQLMWGMTGPGVVKQTASNAGGSLARSEPGSGGTYPDWYVKTNRGQAANLQEAEVCNGATYPNGNCYTMVDRGTFNRLVDSGTITNLAIVSQSNDAGARGGKDLLINPFNVYIVNPDKVAGSTTVNVAAARRFVDFLVSASLQAAVDTFPITIDPAFRSDAFPSVTLTSSLSPTATAGAPVPLTLAFANKQPGTPTIVGMPVQLQQSTDAGKTWSDVGAPQATDADGHVSFAPTIARTTRYRVSLPLFQATDWNMLSPSTHELGTVSVMPTPAPVPISGRGRSAASSSERWSCRDAAGSGSRVGSVYRLADGRLIYVTGR
jgi:tungstate transport system substrate-binding protein